MVQTRKALVVVEVISINMVAPRLSTQQVYEYHANFFYSIVTTYALGVPQVEGLLIVHGVIIFDSQSHHKCQVPIHQV